MTPYETIFSSFLKRIEDEILPKFEESEQNEIMIGYLNDAIAMMTADDLMIEHDLNNKDDDLMEFTDDLNNLEVELLSKVMVVSWYEQKINSIETTDEKLLEITAYVENKTFCDKSKLSIAFISPIHPT